MPRDADLPDRLGGVLAVVYLIFNQGYEGSSGLCAEAVRLGRLLEELMPDEPEVTGPARPDAQAAIQAVHSDAPTADATDWGQIGQLYDQLMAIAPSPVVALLRAVAVAETDGPEQAHALVDALGLDGYRVLHAVRADLLRRLGRDAEAVQAYEAALALAENPAERAFLGRRWRALTRRGPDGPVRDAHPAP